MDVEKARLDKAVSLLRMTAQSGDRALWLRVIKQLTDYGWLSEREVADAVLLAPITWAQEAGLSLRIKEPGGDGRWELGPEDWKLMRRTVEAIAAFRAMGEEAELVQLRDWARGRWAAVAKTEKGGEE